MSRLLRPAAHARRRAAGTAGPTAELSATAGRVTRRPLAAGHATAGPAHTVAATRAPAKTLHARAGPAGTVPVQTGPRRAVPAQTAPATTGLRTTAQAEPAPATAGLEPAHPPAQRSQTAWPGRTQRQRARGKAGSRAPRWRGGGRLTALRSPGIRPTRAAARPRKSGLRTGADDPSRCR